MYKLYFLYDGEDIVYIGRSKGMANFKQRLSNHRRDKKFTSIIYYEVDDYEECKRLERGSIKHHKPKYNKQCIPGRVSSSNRGWYVPNV